MRYLEGLLIFGGIVILVLNQPSEAAWGRGGSGGSSSNRGSESRSSGGGGTKFGQRLQQGLSNIGKEVQSGFQGARSKGQEGLHKLTDQIHKGAEKLGDRVQEGTRKAIESAKTGIEHGKDRIQHKFEDMKQHAGETIKHSPERPRERTQETVHRAKEELGERVRHTVERVQEVRQREWARWSPEVRAYQERVNTDIDKITGRSGEAHAILVTAMQSPNKPKALTVAAGQIAASVGIVALKELPMYDPKRNRVVTVDNYARHIVQTLGVSSASDLGKDPVATTILLMVDRDYLLKARLFPSPDGRTYVSLTDLTGFDLTDPQVRQAKDAYYASHFSWEKRDAPKTAHHLQRFARAVRQVNLSGRPSIVTAEVQGTSGLAVQALTAATGVLVTRSLHPVVVAEAEGNVGRMLFLAAGDGGRREEPAIREAQEIVERLGIRARLEVGDRKTARAANKRGLQFLRDGTTDVALTELTIAHRADPADVEVLNNLAYAHMRAGNQSAAEGGLVLTLMMAPDRTSAWSNLGQVYARQGKNEIAIASFANAFRYSKDQTRTREFFQNLAENDPDIAVREAVRVTLQLDVTTGG